MAGPGIFRTHLSQRILHSFEKLAILQIHW
jgi:hypothetical protein